ncbi:MAG: hypothetical protein RL625_1529 [Gemmatimonadota bacterium]|jgi:N-formylglutamate amidohydrolase
MNRRGPHRVVRTALGILAILGAVGCGGASSSVAPTAPTTPTTPTAPAAPLPVADWVEGIDGQIPLVIIAPHGGDLAPAELPDRVCTGCVTGNDLNTQALARAISDAFSGRIGKRPYLVINRLHRRKFDANRDLQEATAGYAPLAPMWSRFQAEVDSAKVRAHRLHPRALVIDLHGHGHAIQRLELGYLLSASELRLTDAAITALMPTSSVAQLSRVAVSRDSGVVLLRGARSLGSRFAALGIPAVPSDADPAPLEGQDYFNGGFNTVRHGSLVAGPVDAIQIESHYTGLRDTAANRAGFAEVFVTAMLAYLRDHYGWVPA